MLRCFLALATLCAAVAATGASPAPVSVYPIRTAAGAISLNGTWDFLHVPRVATESPSDVALASKITVPGHWELQGFCEPKYRAPDEGTGYYRRTFRIPESWLTSGQRVCLRFEGVLYGFDVWINGKLAGEWGSGYNPVTFDITSLINPDPAADNTIDVRVTTRNKGWEFDTNDCWGISGIYRDVFLFAVPATHLKNFSTRTTLNPDGSATLALKIDTAGGSLHEIRGKLIAPDGAEAGVFSTRPKNNTAAVMLEIAVPKLWTAETPHLYTLELTLLDRDNKTPVQTITEKIGLRQITIDGPVLKLNGTPVKLRGVNHHDIWPDVGRACAEEHIRRDLELMRAANINFIRTSHYPPHRRLLDLCDEMGFYVMCEVPFGFGDKHLTDPAYQDILYTRARATIARDQNHPSIIVWSVGNENPITDIQLETGREVKRLDPTRPICFPTVGSYFEKNYERFPDFVDIYAPHYPPVKTLARHAQTLRRPVIVTEYAHALGLASERFAALWEIMRTSPNMAGGAIWMFQDQGILRTGDINDPALAAQPYVWPDATHYYDTGEIDGMDGIVYSDRRPQSDYHELRKVYSPVFIPENEITIAPETRQITLHIENRHDFRSLNNYKLTWEIEVNGKPAKQGEIALRAPAQKTESLEIPLDDFRPVANDITILNLKCLDDTGRQIYERSLKFAKAWENTPRQTLMAMQPGSGLTLEKTPDTIRVKHTNFTIATDRATGKTTITAPDGRTLVAGIHPHTGRRFTEADKTRVVRSKAEIWPETILDKPDAVETEATDMEGVVKLDIRTQHPATYGTIQGGYGLLIFANGTIDVGYGYNIRGKGQLLEAGLSLVAPPDFTEYRWIGLGPLPSYPYKTAAAEYGRHHLARGDLNFSGNRRGTDLAALTRPDGSGILIADLEGDIAVEAPLSPGGSMTLSHNALISSRGNKGAAPELEIHAENFGYMSGSFTLIPLSNTWPDLLVRWLGPPDARGQPDTPYLRSYDQ